MIENVETLLRDFGDETGTVDFLGETYSNISYYDVQLKVKRLPHYEGLDALKVATAGSAGIDLYAANLETVMIPGQDYRVIPTGICVELPPYYCGLVLPRSGLSAKKGLTILNAPGLIDSDYRGEIFIILANTTTNKYYVNRGERIAQFLVQPAPSVQVIYSDELGSTERGEGKFGSTGV